MALVTLTTDFGTVDGYVGAMKGVLCRLAPGITVVDLAHDIPRHDVVAAAFALAQAVPQFPAGSIHVVVVDPGVGGRRRPVVVDAAGQVLVGPDNGVLSLVAKPPCKAYAIERPGFVAANPSTTFHGRDVFAVAAARLASGACASEVGPAVALGGGLALEGERRTSGDSVFARVIHVDAFGNLITDLRGDALPERPRFRVRGRYLDRLSECYEDVERGALLAYLGSGGTLELATREGSAARDLDMARGDTVEVVAGDPDQEES